VSFWARASCLSSGRAPVMQASALHMSGAGAKSSTWDYRGGTGWLLDLAECMKSIRLFSAGATVVSNLGKLACRYTLHDMREYGRKKGWCPYFLARHMLAFANVMVYNYQYMLDPKVCSCFALPLLASRPCMPQRCSCAALG